MFDSLFVLSMVVCLFFVGALFENFLVVLPYFLISLAGCVLFGKLASMDHKMKKQEERIKKLEEALGIEQSESTDNKE